MLKLVLLRHGESQWNKENRFTGWTDVDLSPKGIEEAHTAGSLLLEAGYIFDIAYTSVLKRAIRTLWIVLDKMDLMWIPVVKSWRLNERHYGALQGLNKKETAEIHGEEKVHEWRRSFDIAPPPLSLEDKRYPGKDQRYSGLSEEEIPLTESLKDTIERFIPYWHEVISKVLHGKKRVLITAHGNSLRALVKYLDSISDEEIASRNIPTGVPFVYELNDSLQPERSYYLGDNKAVEEAINKVKNQEKQTK